MLLRTRFYLPPLREKGIVRQALLDRLQASQSGSVILVTAPAGYGKTTLVSQWLHLYPHTFSWLLLGESHNGSQAFWRYLVTALHQVLPTVGEDALSMLDAASPDYQTVMTSLLNDLDGQMDQNVRHVPISLVLDDFHCVKEPQLLDQFCFFLDNLPVGIRLVITSRDTPDIGVAGRLVRGQLIVFGVKDLRFNRHDVARFFQETMSIQASEAIIDGVANRTEGWVAGLQLVAISLRQSSLQAQTFLTESKLDRHISDYLLEEVFLSQSEDLKRFLLITALTRRFCAGLCNAMLKQRSAAVWMEQLEKKDLFLVSLDNHRTWYRYHELFRQFLLQRWQAHPEEKDVIFELALCWYRDNGEYQDAVEMCIQHERWESAFDLLLEWHCVLPEPEGTAGCDQTERLIEWLKLFPNTLRAGFLQRIAKPFCSTALESASDQDASDKNALTAREQAVLELLSQGLPNKHIADQLHISLNTLKVHIRNLYQKLGVSNRRQALLKVLK